MGGEVRREAGGGGEVEGGSRSGTVCGFGLRRPGGLGAKGPWGECARGERLRIKEGVVRGCVQKLGGGAGELSGAAVR